MQHIRTLGAIGIFHILIPGLFLLLNIVGGIYIFPLTSSDTQEQIQNVFGNPVLGIMITIVFGYLIGITLRMFRSEYPDQLSAKFIRFCYSNLWFCKTDKTVYADYEKFPYTQWMETSIYNLPDVVKDFYKNTWKH